MHSLRAALTSAALLALVLIPVALYLAHRLRPFVCAAEAHLYLCLAALPPALVACYALGLPSRSRPWLLLALALLAVVQIGSVRLAVLVLHRLFQDRVVRDYPVPELPTPAELAHAPEVAHV